MMIALLFACTISSPLPKIGDCAEYPDETYDYGQIGIGTCLAGASSLQFQSTDTEDYLLVSNSNPYVLFSGGSLLSIPWSSIDLSKPINYSHELPSYALPTPSFNGNMVVTGDDIGLLTVRYSEGSRTSTDLDYIYFIDLSDPSKPQNAPIGVNGAERLQVEADPVDVVFSEETGFAYVGNRSSHDLSIINTQADPMSIVAPWPLSSLRDAEFLDEDLSGSHASLIELEDLVSYYADDEEAEAVNLTDDVWRFDWIEGSWQLWLPKNIPENEENEEYEEYEEYRYYQRYETIGDHHYSLSNIEDEFSALEVSVETPFLLDSQMFFSYDGIIGSSSWNTQNHEWEWSVPEYFSIAETALSSPSWMIEDAEISLIFAAEDDQGWWIGQAGFDIGGNLRAEKTLISSDEDITRVSEPFVFKEDLANQWRLYYSVLEDARWTIRSKRTTNTVDWIDTAGFSIEGMDVGAPVISEEADRIRMWYAIGSNNVWDIAYAESIDGETWKDFGVVIPLALEAEEPPRAALQAYPISAFRLEGEAAGYIELLENSSTFFVDSYGWKATVLAGQWFDTDLFGADSSGGIEVSSVVSDSLLLSLTNATGTKQIGSSDETGENAQILFSPDEGSDGVFQPVVWEKDGALTMFYAEEAGDTITIQKAIRSAADQEWDQKGQALELGTDFDSIAMVPSSVYKDAQGLHLIYAGFDGKSWRIGKADSTDDGLSWTRTEEPWFDLGKAGEWDDSGVKDGFVQVDAESIHLWYSGFDGRTWSIGYATLFGDEWSREQTSLSPEGMFYNTGASHPVLLQDEGKTQLYYAGNQNGINRVGKAVGSSAVNLRQIYQSPTLGDSMVMETHRTDVESDSIPIPSRYEDPTLLGIGLTDITIDQERGFLYVATDLMPHILVFDIRDDSQGDFVDRNYLDVETKIFLPSSWGSAGFRQIIPHPDGKHLMAICDTPEAIFFANMDEIEDNEYTEEIYDIQTGFLPLPAVGERYQDKGVDTRATIGPGQMLLHPDQNRLFVSNFNANTVSIFDLSLGSYGREIVELQTNGENPYAMTISPNGDYLIVSNFTGDVIGNQSNTTLSIFDINPLSETAYTLVTQVVNQ